MAFDYSKIKDKKLVKLIQESPALSILPEPIKDDYLKRIAALPDTGEKRLLTLLEKQNKSLPKLTTEEKIAIFEAGIKALKNMMRNFDRDVRVKDEEADTKAASKDEAKLLEELDHMD